MAPAMLSDQCSTPSPNLNFHYLVYVIAYLLRVGTTISHLHIFLVGKYVHAYAICISHKSNGNTLSHNFQVVKYVPGICVDIALLVSVSQTWQFDDA